jgi:4Fe-4S ferredoxin
VNNLPVGVEPASSLACRQAAGHFEPVINRNRCEGKGPCVSACPFDVLAMSQITRAERADLGLVGRLKVLAHGGKQARAVAPDLCQACGECVRVCPEDAITLRRIIGREST